MYHDTIITSKATMILTDQTIMGQKIRMLELTI